jgi:hypothetical protein
MRTFRRDDDDERVIPLDSRREAPKKPKAERPEFDLEEVFKDMGIRSFKTEYKRLSKMAGADDFSGQQATYALLRSQFAMLINSLPIVEEAMHKYKSDRSAYAMVALSNHLREVAHDLRSYDDNSAMVEKIRGEVVRNLLTTLATAVVSRLIDVRKKVGARSASKDARYAAELVRKVQEEMTRVFSEAEAESVERIQNVLRR